MRYLFLFFIAIPLIEMLILFEVSDLIGGLLTLSLVVATAVIGVQILKRQGVSTLLRANQRIESGELPAQEIVEGMLLAGAGALLLTPGFVTDTMGFLFLTPAVRRRIAGRIIKSGVMSVVGGRGAAAGFTQWHTRRGPSSYPPGGGHTFEGEFSRHGGEIPPDDNNEKPQKSDQIH